MRLIRILLVDDDEAVRDGMAVVLSAQSDIELVGEADNREDALKLTREHTPNVVLLDIGIPGDDGLDIARQILVESPQVRVIIFTALSYREQEVMSLGLTFLLKGCSTDELMSAIRG